MIRPIAHLLAACAILAAPLAAQRSTPTYATCTDPDEIEKAYRAAPPFGEIQFERVDRLPFVFFIEDQGRGSLAHLADQRFHALKSIVDLFESRFAEPLQLKRRDRPMPFWILKDRASYEKVGGSKFSLAHFNALALHTVTFQNDKQETYEAFHTAMHEAVHQIMYAYTNPDDPVHLNMMSAWLMEGMAEHLASRPRTPLLANRDPEFGFVDVAKIRECSAYIGKSFSWKRRSKLSWLHHPMFVMTFRYLPEYMQATGMKQEDAADYQTQMVFFYRSAYAIVAFLDHAFDGRFRPKLLQALKVEYAGRRGAATLQKVWTAEERAALPRLFGMFVQNPLEVSKATLPEGADRATPMEGDDATSEADKPEEAARDAAPAPLRLARAMRDYRRLDLGAAEDGLQGIDDPAATKLREHIEVLDELITAFGGAVTEQAGKATITLPLEERGGSTLRAHRIAGWDNDDMRLSVTADRKDREVFLYDVPSHLFAEAVEKLELLDDRRRAALGLLVGLELRRLTGGERRTVEQRARRHGFLPESELLASVGPMLDIVELFAAAARELEKSEVERVLGSVAERVRSLPPGPQTDAIVRAETLDLLDRAFARSPERLPPLRGRVTSLPDGRVRIEYDWKDQAQLEDWERVDPAQTGIAVQDVLGYDASKTKIVVRDGRLEIRGPAYLRHRLSFEGDLVVSTVVPTQEVKGEDGEPRMAIFGPPVWLLHARSGNVYALATWNVLAAFVQGRRRNSAHAEGPLLQDLVRAVREGKPIRIERRGDDVLVGPEGGAALKMDGSRVKADGALLMVQPAPVAADDAMQGAVGRTVVEGTPAAAGGAQKQVFVRKWLPQFGLRE